MCVFFSPAGCVVAGVVATTLHTDSFVPGVFPRSGLDHSELKIGSQEVTGSLYLSDKQMNVTLLSNSP